MEAKDKLARMSNISLSLDGYNDIFSDFDPRPYSERAISVDFLDEARRATRNTQYGGIELKLMLEKKKRNLRDESAIKTRLKKHFVHHFNMLREERSQIRNKGILFVLFGIILMFLTTYVIFFFGQNEVYLTFIVVMLEPAGWFLFWEGLNMALFESKKETHDLRFYEKMVNCKITFISY